jgi:D-mannonate dehydratase
LAALLIVLHDKGCSVPFRADHAPGMYGHDLNFGYGLVARAQGLSYLNGVLQGLSV